MLLCCFQFFDRWTSIREVTQPVKILSASSSSKYTTADKFIQQLWPLKWKALKVNKQETNNILLAVRRNEQLIHETHSNYS